MANELVLKLTDSDFSSNKDPISQYMMEMGRNSEEPTLNSLELTLSGAIADSLVQESLRTALNNKVRNLDLYLPGCVLGRSVFGGDSILNLKLRECKLRTLSLDQIKCNNIKRLNFYLVYLDGFMFENILCGCPLLEEVKISLCGGEYGNFDSDGDSERDGDSESDTSDGLTVIQIKNHANLRRVDAELHVFQKLILGEVPRLESLVCANDENYLGELEDRSEEDDDDWMPCGFSLHSSPYQNVNTLVLCAVDIDDKFFANFINMFPNVQDLSIQHCHGLRMLNLSSHVIKRIQLDENRRLKKVEFNVPMMVCFEYRSETEFIPLFSFTGSSNVSGGMVSFLNIYCRYNVPYLWFRRLEQLLSDLVPAEIVLRIRIHSIPDFNIDEVRNAFASFEPLTVEELSLHVVSKESKPSAPSILFCLFWILRPRIICQRLVDKLDENLLMKMLYEMLILKRSQNQVKFWQSDLKSAEVGTFKDDVSDTWRCKGYEPFEMGDNVLDWQGFLAVTKTTDKGICFKFEWETSEVPKEAKRFKV